MEPAACEPGASVTLEPCPYCGSRYALLTVAYGEHYGRCCVCGAVGPSDPDRDEAAAAWNTVSRTTRRA
jgi:hypothetical protein